MSLLYIGQQITIYGGLFIVIIGLVGNGINVLVFSTVRAYRISPSTFYFLIGSVDNIAYIAINLISQIVIVNSRIDLTRTAITWCKMRQFSLSTLSLITLSCSCLATIDQFCTTSQNVLLRRFSNIKWAHRIVITMIIIWCLVGIFPLVFFQISSDTKTCISIDTPYSIYALIYLLGMISTIPAIVMVLFGYLTYHNIHLIRNLAEQYADRQLTRMILIQVVLVVICIVPSGVNSVYLLITSEVNKDADRLLSESFALTIITLVSYCYYAGSCYIFLLSSSRFRRAIKGQIYYCLRSNRIIPVQQRPVRRRN